MTRRLRYALLLTVLAAALSPAASALASDASYIVVLKNGASPHADAARNGVTPRHVFGSALQGYSASLSRGQLKKLQGDAQVAYVKPDRRISADGRRPVRGNAGSTKPSGGTSTQTFPRGLDRIDAELSSTRPGDGTGTVTGPAIAVLDSGSGPHPDLNVVGGKACTGNTYDDGNGHGTHVAGTIAAKDDGAGVVGIVPGAPIYSVRVLDASLGGYQSDLICGIDWVTANARSLGIKVANLSLSQAGTDDRNCGNTNNDPVHKAICASIAQGVTYVAAAGNSTQDLAKEVPAAYDEVLAVTALSDANGRPGGGGTMPKGCTADVDDSAADFSNFAVPGTTDVNHTIAAPGKCIYSDWKGGGYSLSSGTSMAAPHAAGAVALCIASGACAGLTPAQIITKLRTDAAAQPASYGFTDDPRTPIAGRYYGYLLYDGRY